MTTARVEVAAIAATTHPLSAYGGVQLTVGALESMRAQLLAGSTAFAFHHDPRAQTDAKVLSAEIRPRTDGEHELVVTYDVDEVAWREYESRLKESGAPGGISFSGSETVAVIGDGDPVIELAANPHHFADDLLYEAAQTLAPLGPIQVERYYQFSAEPPATVVIVLSAIASIPAAMMANYLYDALKRFLRSSGKSIFHFHVREESGKREVTGYLETDSPRTLRRALETFERIVESSELLEFDEGEGEWRPANPRDSESGP